MSRRCFLIVNPTSGSYSPRRIDAVMARLSGAGFSPQLLITGSADDASRFAARICTEETDPFIIAGGGDGTVNGVVNGLVPGMATLGVLPLGTANVLAKELGIGSVHEAVEKLVRQRERSISAGMLEAAGESRYFLLMAGIGFDGAVVEGVRLGEKRLMGKGAYVLSALRVLADWDRRQFTISIDGRDISCHGAVICNASKYGGNFVLAPGAELFSPEFQVVYIRDGSRTAYLKLLMGMATGKISGSGIAVMGGREIIVGGDKAVQVDGDFHCHGPLRVSLVENFVNIIV
ncbi:diacylglycerol kinase family protein [Geotalea sp. SG265]|uniref:diacylglycerol/lipid kinase family protein n=1 Tax=Geotalea sp. SG265 TaxID=2922867 RepID=UPI001FB02475|nr:diacylglycerol kinase family protein [Geotalea sp. SG265]